MKDMTRHSSARLLAATTAVLLLGACSSQSSPSSASPKICGISDASGWDSNASQTPAKRAIAQAASEIGGETKLATGAGELKGLLEDGCTIIVSEGQGIAEATTQAAHKYSKVRFIAVDSDFVAGGKPSEVSNGKVIASKATQGAYLAGYATAGMTTTGTIAGFGGVETSERQALMDAFMQGIDAYNQAYGTSIRFLGWDPTRLKGTFTGSDDESSIRDAATKALSGGADILVPFADAGNQGALRALEEAGNNSAQRLVWMGDGAPTNSAQIITAVSTLTKDHLSEAITAARGSEFSSQAVIDSLDNNGVVLAPFAAHEALMTPDLKDALATMRQQMITGELVISTPFDPLIFSQKK